MLAFFRNDMGLGGNNGLTDFRTFWLQRPGAGHPRRPVRPDGRSAGLGLSRRPVHDDLGLRQGADRDPRRRVPHPLPRLPHGPLQGPGLHRLGDDVRGWPAPSTCRRSASSTRPSFAPANSIEAVIWVAVGGRGTLVGAALGAVLVNNAKTPLTGAAAGCQAVRAWRLSSSSPCSCPKGHPRHPVRAPRRAAAKVRTDIPPLSPRGPRIMSAAVALPLRPGSREAAHPGTPLRRRHQGHVRRLPALRGLSLTQMPGEMRAIIGPNGAGKTTMKDCIHRQDPPEPAR